MEDPAQLPVHLTPIAESIQRTEHGTLMTLDTGAIPRIVGAIQSKVKEVSVLHTDPPILCAPTSRVHVRRMTDRFLPRCAVVSANDLAPELELESLGTVQLT